MASALKVYACVQWDAQTETCQAHAYIDPPTIVPTMTAEQGSAIGIKMLGVIVLVRCIALMREAVSDRIGPGY